MSVRRKQRARALLAWLNQKVIICGYPSRITNLDMVRWDQADSMSAPKKGRRP